MTAENSQYQQSGSQGASLVMWKLIHVGKKGPWDHWKIVQGMYCFKGIAPYKLVMDAHGGYKQVMMDVGIHT